MNRRNCKQWYRKNEIIPITKLYKMLKESTVLSWRPFRMPLMRFLSSIQLIMWKKWWKGKLMRRAVARNEFTIAFSCCEMLDWMEIMFDNIHTKFKQFLHKIQWIYVIPSHWPQNTLHTKGCWQIVFAIIFHLSLGGIFSNWNCSAINIKVFSFPALLTAPNPSAPSTAEVSPKLTPSSVDSTVDGRWKVPSSSLYSSFTYHMADARKLRSLSYLFSVQHLQRKWESCHNVPQY